MGREYAPHAAAWALHHPGCEIAKAIGERAAAAHGATRSSPARRSNRVGTSPGPRDVVDLRPSVALDEAKRRPVLLRRDDRRLPFAR
jgi:hypothetical protein